MYEELTLNWIERFLQVQALMVRMNSKKQKFVDLHFQIKYRISKMWENISMGSQMKLILNTPFLIKINEVHTYKFLFIHEENQ